MRITCIYIAFSSAKVLKYLIESKGKKKKKKRRMKTENLFMLFYPISKGHLPCCPNAVRDNFLAYQNLSSLEADLNFQL